MNNLNRTGCRFFLFASLFCFSNSWSQVSSTQYSREVIADVRKAMETSTKTYCVNFWTESESKKQALYKSGITLSAQCGCTQQEVNYLMSDDLAVNAYIGFDDLEKGKPVSPALQQWNKLVFSSMQMCSEKLMRRR
jgi:hypothetical protein